MSKVLKTPIVCGVINPIEGGFQELVSTLKSGNYAITLVPTKKGTSVLTVTTVDSEEAENPRWIGNATIVGFLHPTKKSGCKQSDLASMAADGAYKLQAAKLGDQDVVLFLQA